GSLLPLRDGRTDHSLRAAILHQYDGQPAHDARQGHDTSLHLLRWILARRRGVRHGHGPRPHAQATAFRRDRRRLELPRSGGPRIAAGRRVNGTTVLLCAGGTGGHLFPAEALAAALAKRGVAVELATDERGAPYARGFPARRVHAIPSETVRSRSPLSM